MQINPALPWAAGQRGTIILQEPVTKEDLANGALLIVTENGDLLNPSENDDYVDYYNGQTQVGNIAIQDGTEQNTLVINNWLVGVSSIIKQEPLGVLLYGYDFQKIDGTQLEEGDSAIVVGVANQEDCLFSLDGGNSVLAGTYSGNDLLRLVSSGSAITEENISQVPKPTSGPFANTPIIPVRLMSDDNAAYLEAQYRPTANEGLMRIALKNSEGETVDVGDDGPAYAESA